MARAIFVKAARKDYPDDGIKKGESYWHWKFRYGSLHRSKTQPKASQLTQSAFLSSIYDLNDRIETMGTDADLDSEVSDIISELESLRDECQEKHDNMPEQLQDSGLGETLQNRVDSLEDMIGQLEGVDLSIDIDEEEITDGVKEDNVKDPDETAEVYAARVEEMVQEKVEEATEERKQEILDEIQGITYDGE